MNYYNINQIDMIPRLSGIYYFYEVKPVLCKHNLLYIGKAKNLRYRVSNHYTDVYSHQKINMVMQRVTRIGIEVNLNYNQLHTIETRLIHELKPLFNYQTCVTDKEIDDQIRELNEWELKLGKIFYENNERNR